MRSVSSCPNGFEATLFNSPRPAQNAARMTDLEAIPRIADVQHLGGEVQGGRK